MKGLPPLGALGLAVALWFAARLFLPAPVEPALRWGLIVAWPTALAVLTWSLCGGPAQRPPLLKALGLARSPARGLMIALACVLPMAMTLFITTVPLFELQLSSARLLERTLGSALGEEIFFRGLVMALLLQIPRIPLSRALLLNGLLFGLAHLPGAWAGGPGHAATIGLITGAGGAFYAWLWWRWGRDLWLPIGLHLLMNLCWEIWAVGLPGGASGLSGQIGRGLTIVLAVAFTLRLTRVHPQR